MREGGDEVGVWACGHAHFLKEGVCGCCHRAGSKRPWSRDHCG